MSSSTALQVTCYALVFLAACILCTDTKINVTIVNGEVDQSVNCTFVEACRLRQLSIRYLAHLSKQPVSPAYSADLDAALKDLKSSKSDTAAVLYFNENFTDYFVAKIALEEIADDETLESAQIQVWVAPEQADTLRPYLQTAFDQFVKDLLGACGLSVSSRIRYALEKPIRYYYLYCLK